MLIALLVAVLVPFSITLSGLWSATGRDLSIAQSERTGVTYLGPVVRLIGATADAGSTAVAGDRPNTAAVDKAIRAVDAVDARYGAALGVSERWATARKRLIALLTTPPTGQQAYTSFGQNLDLLLALASTVGDSSSLILDPELDSYYLMDTTLLRIPQLLVSSGQVSDLANLLGGQASGSPALAAAAEQARQDGAAVKTGLGKSFAATQSPTLSQGLVPALDRFGDSMATLAPPTAGITFVAQPAVALQQERGRVRDAALTLESVSLDQLDRLLQDRADAATSQRRLAVAATAAGALLAITVLWLAVSRRRRTPIGPGVDEPGEWDAQLAGSIPAPNGQEALNGRQLARAGQVPGLETKR